MHRMRRNGFTLMELLVVVAIIGILAVMAIVNYYVGLQRARQKRTMTDMRAIAASWEARASDMKGYNAAGWSMPAEILTVTQMEPLVTPTYTKSLPHIDAWGHPYEFGMDQPVGGLAAMDYAIRSSGADGLFESTYTQGNTTKFDCDIVYSDGAFIVSPESH